jgi:hypothetical protein
MPGLVPGIHDFLAEPAMIKDVDGRNKSGHDGISSLLEFPAQ